MLQTVLSSVYVLICFLLLIVVLLQQGKGGDIAAAFGGGSSQTAFGARAGATVLTRATTVLGALFMVGALALSIIGQRGGTGSVVGSVPGPAPVTPVQTAPAAPANPTAQPSGTPQQEQKKPGGEGQTQPPGNPRQ